MAFCIRTALCVLAGFCLGIVLGANNDSVALNAFKSAISEDPEGVLSNWNSSEQSPCNWTGIICAETGHAQRVVGISLPKRRLVGTLPSALGSLIYLRHINLKHNSFRRTLPSQLLSIQSLQSVVISGNSLSGPLPQEVGNLRNLQILDLSYNSFEATIPSAIINCTSLRKLILSDNAFSGPIPRGLGLSLSALQQLDLSFNKLTGIIPPDLGNLSNLEGTLKLSHNFLSGPVPATLGKLPEKVSLDLTYNNLSGPVPQNGALANQGPTAFVGNPKLCGLPLRDPCSNPYVMVPSSAVPSVPLVKRRRPISKAAIIAIVAGDVGGITILGLVFLYCYWRAVRCREKGSAKEESSSSGRGKRLCHCLSTKRDDSDGCSENLEKFDLVPLDGQVTYDLDELLRASAFVLCKSGIGIVYKVVLEDGLTLAVRRLGEGGIHRYKEFQAEVESISRVRHPNIVPLRAYYWSLDEKLLIYDYIPNGSLALALHGVADTSTRLLWAARLKIAKGVAKGLAYIHECSPKKHIHGDLKPTNILLDFNMEPYIADFGLGRIASLVEAFPISANFTVVENTQHHPETNPSSSENPSSALSPLSAGILMPAGSAYQAPEALKSSKPTQKWDVYSYGVILLELLSGRPPMVPLGSNEVELVRWVQLCIEEKQPLQHIIDPILIREAQREEEILALLKIALNCVQGSPEKRPPMKQVLELLDKISAFV